MVNERWHKIEEIFEKAVELPAAEREQYLKSVCNGDDDIRREVEMLIAADSEAEEFIEEPLLGSHTLSNFLSESNIDDSVPPHFIGRRIGAYRLIRELGRGGMGAVFLAQRADDEFRKSVAIKLIKRGMDTDFILKRFRNERQILATLDHPNIARLLDGGTTDDNLPYFVMEYIEGEPIHRFCDSNQLSIKQRLKLFQKVCSAVNYAHQNLIIHRDLKPGNILVTRDSVPKLLDFGIAKILNPDLALDTLSPTLTGMRMMTPEYASPEQVRGETLTPASDIYSLGVLLFELLTGKRPYRFSSRAPHEIARVICEERPGGLATVIADDAFPSVSKEKTPKNIDVLSRNRGTTPEVLQRELSGSVQNILLKALRKSPNNRYTTADEFARDIQSYLDGLPISAPQIDFSTDESFDDPPSQMEILAVLPFRTFRWKSASNGDIDTGDFLSLGLADALISRLSNLKTISVRPTSSIVKYSAGDIEPEAAGRELKVSHVLDGRIQHIGKRVRVTAQLIRLQTTETVWAGQFDEESDDILSLQDSISSQVAHALFAQLTGEESEKIKKRGTENAKAYECYLRGRFYWHTYEVEGLAKALVCFYEAIAQDPNFALAYTGVADYFNFLSIFGVMSPEESFPAAKEAAQKAIELDETLAEAYTSLAITTFGYDWDFAESERLFKKSIELNPNYGDAHVWYSHVLGLTGRHDEALKEMKKGERLNTVSPSLLINYAICLRNARKYEDALSKIRQALAIQPNYYIAAQGYGWIIDFLDINAEALKACQTAVEKTGRLNLPLYALGYVLATIGRTEEARKIVQELEERRENQYVPPIYMVLIYAALGENDLAFDWLETSFSERDFWAIWLPVDPRYEKLKNDPRYKDFVKRIRPQEDLAIHQSYIETKILPPENQNAVVWKTSGNLIAEEEKVEKKVSPKNKWWRYAVGAAGLLGLFLVVFFVGLRYGYQFGFRNKIQTFPQRLTFNPGNDSLASVSNDGRRIAFTSNRDGFNEIYLMNSEGGEVPTRLTVNQVEDTAPSWSPNDEKIVFERVTVPSAESDIYAMDADGSNQLNLTNESGYDTQAEFSPDGTRIAFASNRGNVNALNFDIYVMNADGTNVVKLTDYAGYDNSPSWSPDGRQITFMRGITGGDYEIFVMNADGSNQRNISNNPAHEANPSWSPDGKFIAFSSNRGLDNKKAKQIFVSDTDGGNVRQVTKSTENDDYVTWFPDSRRLIFSSNREGNNEIYVTDIFNNTEVTNSESSRKTIAILPFITDEKTPQEEELSLGLAQVLTRELGLVEQISVSPAFVRLTLEDKTEAETLEMGKQVGATHILRGRLHKTPENIEVFAELAEVAGGKVIWSEKFNEPMSDLRILQNSISERVLSALTIELTSVEKQKLNKKYTENSEAYHLYLVGRYQMSKRTVESLQNALKSFNGALEKDPNFALAYAGLADVHILLNLYLLPPPADGFEKAKVYATKALQLDESLAEPYASLGFAAINEERNLEKAEMYYKKAIRLNSSYESVHHWLALALVAQGKGEEAIQEINTAKRLAPNNAQIAAASAIIRFYIKDYEQAERDGINALKIEEKSLSALSILRWISIIKGDFQKAEEYLERENQVRGGSDSITSLLNLAHVQAGKGDRASATAILNRVFDKKEYQAQPDAFAYDIALVYVFLGENEETFIYLDKTTKHHRAVYINIDPRFEKLHADPRFNELVKKIKTH